MDTKLDASALSPAVPTTDTGLYTDDMWAVDYADIMIAARAVADSLFGPHDGSDECGARWLQIVNAMVLSFDKTAY